MSVQITFLLTLLVLTSQASADALKDYYISDTRHSSSKIHLNHFDYTKGLVLKSRPDAKPLKAIVKIRMGDYDGVVLSSRLFGSFVCRNGTAHSGEGDILKAEYSFLTVNFCSNDSRAVMPNDRTFFLRPEEVIPAITYDRRGNSTSRFELSVTPFRGPSPCGTDYECGEAEYCVFVKSKCDRWGNCEEESRDEVCLLYTPMYSFLKIFGSIVYAVIYFIIVLILVSPILFCEWIVIICVNAIWD